MTIQWIAWFVLLTLIHWIANNSVDSVIQPLNSRGQVFTCAICLFPCPISKVIFTLLAFPRRARLFFFIPIKAFKPALGTKQITAICRFQHAIWRCDQRITSKNCISKRKDPQFRSSSVFGVAEIWQRSVRVLNLNLNLHCVETPKRDTCVYGHRDTINSFLIATVQITFIY